MTSNSMEKHTSNIYVILQRVIKKWMVRSNLRLKYWKPLTVASNPVGIQTEDVSNASLECFRAFPCVLTFFFALKTNSSTSRIDIRTKEKYWIIFFFFITWRISLVAFSGFRMPIFSLIAHDLFFLLICIQELIRNCHVSNSVQVFNSPYSTLTHFLKLKILVIHSWYLFKAVTRFW